MVLFLRNHEIRGLMDVTEYIDAVEAGYREYRKRRWRCIPPRKPLHRR